jgi:hypothetical protein
MVHTIIHRGLTPQTVTHAWLVLTLVLTFALAIAHAATMQGGALISGDVLRGASPVVAHALPPAPAAPSAVAVAVERDDATRHARPGGPAASSADPAAPASTVGAPEPVRSRRASALAELYGGPGPHGPPTTKGSR